MLSAAACAAGHGCDVCYPHICSLLTRHGWVCSRGTKHTLIVYSYNLRAVDAKVLNPKGPNIFVHSGDTAHSSNKRRSSITDTKQAPNESTSHSSTAQMDVPHTHGVACWWCCCASFLTLCSLRVGCAHGGTHERAQHADRMLRVVSAHDLLIFFWFRVVGS